VGQWINDHPIQFFLNSLTLILLLESFIASRRLERLEREHLVQARRRSHDI